MEEVEPHRFHKKKPFDCGNTQCGLCRNTWGSSGVKYKTDYFDELAWDDETKFFILVDEFDAWVYDGWSHMAEEQYDKAQDAMKSSARASSNLLKYYFGTEGLLSVLSHFPKVV